MRRVRLTRIALSYADGTVLHTATSGAVPGLDELRLVVEDDGIVAALGASRMNIAYLSGIAPETLVAQCVAAVAAVDWSLPWVAIVASLDAAWPALPAAARMLVEMAAADGAARAAGLTLTEHLLGSRGAHAQALPTNQTLFRSDDATLLDRAARYVARGFTELKLRVGFGSFADDLRRLHLLRARFGEQIQLSVDANASWATAEAPARLAALAPLRLCYVEQPIAPGDWAAQAALSRAAPMPLMLDESLASLADVSQMVQTGAARLAHLKLAKLGGLDRLLTAGAMLHAAGISFMVGQMNEGSVSTLAAAHAGRALGAAFHELYGADGLVDDPAGLLRYDGGLLHLPAGPGLGLSRHGDGGALLWAA